MGGEKEEEREATEGEEKRDRGKEAKPNTAPGEREPKASSGRYVK